MPPNNFIGTDDTSGEFEYRINFLGSFRRIFLFDHARWGVPGPNGSLYKGGSHPSALWFGTGSAQSRLWLGYGLDPVKWPGKTTSRRSGNVAVNFLIRLTSKNEIDVNPS